MNRFPKLFEPLKINRAYTMKNRAVCAPMAFALVACDPEAGEKSFRKLEAPAPPIPPSPAWSTPPRPWKSTGAG